MEKIIEKDNLVRNSAKTAAPHVCCLAFNGVLYLGDKARVQIQVEQID